MLSLVIIGHLGRDAEVKEINGQKVINFSVAHTHTYKNQQGQKVESTTWVRCDMWVQKDALSPYLKKGTQVYCEGLPRIYAYQNDQRQIVGSLQMRVDKLQLLSGGRKEESGGTEIPTGAQAAAAASEIPAFDAGLVKDDLPF